MIFHSSAVSVLHFGQISRTLPSRLILRSRNWLSQFWQGRARFIPGSELAVRVAITPVKNFAFFGALLNDLPVAIWFRAFDIQSEWFGRFTFRIFGASPKFAETPIFNCHRTAAVGAGFGFGRRNRRGI